MKILSFSKIIIIVIMALPIKNYAQKLKYIHRSEVWWIMTHPFIAKRSWKISEKVVHIANAHIKDPDLDGDYNGGQVDAFRHCLWMCLLVQKISPKAALKLGKAHEKGNYRDYKRKRFEDGSLPDSVSSQMDMKNNRVGIDIGEEYFGLDEDTLIQVVKRAVLDGRCWKIKKDRQGNFLDKNDNIIPEKEWKGKWKTPKILVPSDFNPPF